MIYNFANSKGIHTQAESFDDSSLIRLHKRSPISGELNHMDIKLSLPTLDAYYKGNAHVQDIFPDLSADEREFIMTGIPPEEWPEDDSEGGDFCENCI